MSVATFSQGKRHSGFWSSVLDWLQDNNGTVEARIVPYIKIGDWMAPPVSSCGQPPDVAAILNEPYDAFDAMADEVGLSGSKRLSARSQFEKTNWHDRFFWMQAQGRRCGFVKRTANGEVLVSREISAEKRQPANRKPAANSKGIQAEISQPEIHRARAVEFRNSAAHWRENAKVAAGLGDKDCAGNALALADLNDRLAAWEESKIYTCVNWRVA